jgi:hypothetical protein
VVSQYHEADESFTHYFFKFHFNIILQSTPRSLKWSLPLNFSDQNPLLSKNKLNNEDIYQYSLIHDNQSTEDECETKLPTCLCVKYTTMTNIIMSQWICHCYKVLENYNVIQINFNASGEGVIGFNSLNIIHRVRFQVLTAAGMKVTLFLDVAPCSLVEIDRCFRGS